eukprot:3621124-Prymnesium_polylepis.1
MHARTHAHATHVTHACMLLSPPPSPPSGPRRRLMTEAQSPIHLITQSPNHAPQADAGGAIIHSPHHPITQSRAAG